MRRITMVIVVVLVFGMGVALFGGGQQEVAEARETITIQSFLDPEGDSPREVALAEIVETFTAETGIEVEFRLFPWQEMDPQTRLSVEAGNPADVVWTHPTQLNSNVTGGVLQPLTEFANRDLDQSTQDDYTMWEETIRDGDKYAFFTSATPRAIYLRRDWMEEAGVNPPRTWDEFIEVAKALAIEGRDGYLFGGSPAQPNQANMILQYMIEGRGGRLLDDDDRATFDSDAGIETFSFLRAVVHDHGITPRAAATMSYDEMSDAFDAGRVGMIVDGSHRYERHANAVGEENIELVRIPSNDPDQPSPTTVTGWALGIPTGAANPEGGWRFIKHFTSAESQLLNAQVAGEVPIRASTAEDPYFDTSDGAVMGWWIDYLAAGNSMTVGPEHFDQLNEILAASIQEVILDENRDIEEILTNAANEYNSLLD